MRGTGVVEVWSPIERLSTGRNLLGFAGEKTDARMIDAYDAAKRRWTQVRIWGGLDVTAKDGPVVVSSDGTRVRKD